MNHKMENIQGIILTHVHPDHIQAANEIIQRCIPG
jgi:glyoxylase-like metal-dependent hydrolase (beta-lactamase superfamily II)